MPTPTAAPDALERARRVRLMVFDVDGVLTDGRLWYGPQGESLKAFSAHDGLGMKMLAASGVGLALLSSRTSGAVARRAAELGITHVLQGAVDKHTTFGALLAKVSLRAEDAGYMGDDLVDLAVLRHCAFACAPHEAPESVRCHAHYVASAAAGSGAVREVCEFVMQAQGTLGPALGAYLR